MYSVLRSERSTVCAHNSTRATMFNVHEHLKGKLKFIKVKVISNKSQRPATDYLLINGKRSGNGFQPIALMEICRTCLFFLRHVFRTSLFLFSIDVMYDRQTRNLYNSFSLVEDTQNGYISVVSSLLHLGSSQAFQCLELMQLVEQKSDALHSFPFFALAQKIQDRYKRLRK